MGPLLWCGMLSCHLQCQNRTWAEVHVLAAPLLTQLLTNVLGKQQKAAQVFGPLQHHGRPGGSSLLQHHSVLPFAATCGVGGERKMDDLPVSLLCNSDFQINKLLLKKNRINVDENIKKSLPCTRRAGMMMDKVTVKTARMCLKH